MRDRLGALLWRQWAALGVPAADQGDGAWVADLEALLLVTTIQGRHDARLFDAVLDWLWERGGSVNLQRLGNLLKTLGLGDARVLAAIAAWLGQRAIHAPWRKLAQRLYDPSAGIESLFRQKDGRPLPASGPVDETFMKYGLRRGPLEVRGLGVSPNPRDPRALQFTLRSLFGMQARCEVLLWLLTHESGHAADIGRATGYFPGTVEKCLREMAESGFVRAARSGRLTSYWVEPREWAFLRKWDRPEGFPEWRDWPRYFLVVDRFLSVLDRGLSGRLLASELRRVFEDFQPVLVQAGLQSSFSVTPRHLGEAFIQALSTDLDRLLE